ncbi:FlgN protein [Hydrogenispora ethanolica]|jgi:nitrate/nitrite-specific signal transduction histidine kinase|uniref:FlgN protein n=1 Tax=Hydrogenispora ethanolica TaxID=1082276 RepID=A0A4R1RFR1_HYDET|nr:flagellar export chaperone FlgN [Hydrogenispora ethanolica]TCL64804.1 FlgN protein [Hydrogenispora ethanolica]
MSDAQEFELLLGQEIELLQELKGLALAKKAALLNDNLSQLNDIVLREEAAAKKLKEIQSVCSEQTQIFISSAKNGSAIPEPVASYIAQMKKLVLEIKEENEFNQIILQDFLSLVRFTINAWTSMDDDTGTYNPTGKLMTGQNKVNILDFKG